MPSSQCLRADGAYLQPLVQLVGTDAWSIDWNQHFLFAWSTMIQCSQIWTLSPRSVTMLIRQLACFPTFKGTVLHRQWSHAHKTCAPGPQDDYITRPLFSDVYGIRAFHFGSTAVLMTLCLITTHLQKQHCVGWPSGDPRTVNMQVRKQKLRYYAESRRPLDAKCH